MASPGLSTRDIEALRALTDRQVKAASAGDWGAFVGTFSPNVVRMPPDHPPVEGLDAVARWQTTFPRVTHVDNWIDDMGGSGTCAYMRGHNQISLEVDGQTVRLSLKWLAVYEKQSDGSWLMVADMWNGNEPSTGGSS